MKEDIKAWINQIERIHVATMHIPLDKQMAAWTNFDIVCSKVIIKLQSHEKEKSIYIESSSQKKVKIVNEVNLQEIYWSLKRMDDTLESCYEHPMEEGTPESILRAIRRVRVKFNRVFGYRST